MHKVLKCEVDCTSSALGKPKLGSTCARYACIKYFLYHFQCEKGNYEYQCHVSTQINFLTVFITGRKICFFVSTNSIYINNIALLNFHIIPSCFTAFYILLLSVHCGNCSNRHTLMKMYFVSVNAVRLP